MKVLVINFLAILVIVMGLMALSTTPATSSSVFTDEEECKKASCGDCCGDACKLNEDGSCEAKDCSWLRELFFGCEIS